MLSRKKLLASSLLILSFVVIIFNILLTSFWVFILLFTNSTITNFCIKFLLIIEVVILLYRFTCAEHGGAASTKLITLFLNHDAKVNKSIDINKYFANFFVAFNKVLQIILLTFVFFYISLQTKLKNTLLYSNEN